jgi:hypothetical protein
MYTVYTSPEAAKDAEIQRRHILQQFIVEVERVNPPGNLSGPRHRSRAVWPHGPDDLHLRKGTGHTLGATAQTAPQGC